MLKNTVKPILQNICQIFKIISWKQYILRILALCLGEASLTVYNKNTFANQILFC